jgi:hypothetical protein
MDLNKLLENVASVANLMKDQLHEIKTLRADMELMRAEHKQMNEVVTNQTTTMNHFAEIAFDENKFTQALLERCEGAAREAAEEAIDMDEISREVMGNLDIRDEVEAVTDRLQLVNRDTVDDLIESYVSDNNLLDSDEVEDVVADYISHNCDYVEKDVTDELHDEIQELKREIKALKESIAQDVVQLIANKLTGKELHHANQDRDTSVQISGTNGGSKAESDGLLLS